MPAVCLPKKRPYRTPVGKKGQNRTSAAYVHRTMASRPRGAASASPTTRTAKAQATESPRNLWLPLWVILYQASLFRRLLTRLSGEGRVLTSPIFTCPTAPAPPVCTAPWRVNFKSNFGEIFYFGLAFLALTPFSLPEPQPGRTKRP